MGTNATAIQREARVAARAVRRLPLAWHVFLGNTLVIAVAIVVLAVTPASVTVPTHWDDALVLAAGIAALLFTNLVVLRRALSPLDRLTAFMHRIGPLEPGLRVPMYGQEREVTQLTRAFNEMLDRLEAERRDSARRSLDAQEGERRRVAQELHDEVGQALTAIVLQLDRLARGAPSELRDELVDARENARQSLADVRRIAQRLRPEVLEDLGLTSALEALCDRVAEQGDLRVRPLLDRDIEPLPPDVELVLYRVAQEALTNVLRHANATEVVVELSREDGQLLLRVADDGVGIRERANRGSGLQGMRERALLVDGRLSVHDRDRGTELVLRLPSAASAN